ncbi:MAG: M3 family oligoendopeptidase [Chloroflexia bacterium]
MEGTSAPGLPTRSMIAPEHTWDAHSVFPSDFVWETEVAQIEVGLAGLPDLRDQLGTSPAALANWFATSEDLVARADRAYIYAFLFYAADTTDQRAAAMYDRMVSLYSRATALAQSGDPAILAIGFATLRRWCDEEPRLAHRAHAFDRLERTQAHVRSPEVEELLGQAAESFNAVRGLPGIFADADMRFRPATNALGESVAIDQGTAYALLNSPDRETRRTTWESYADAHLAARNTLAASLAAIVKQRVFLARARRYASSAAMALESSFIPLDVLHATLDAFRRNLPIWHRYWRVRRRALGYDTLRAHDIFAPLAAAPLRLPFDRGLDAVAAALAPLGDDYVATMLRGVNEWRWVDKYPSQGKRQGAFQTGVPGTHPVILTNYTDDLDSLSGLAHELGHAMHSHYAWTTQPYCYANYSDFTAEVASNAHEVLVRAHLLATSDDPNTQLAIIDQAMSRFGRYFFIMPTLARLELAIHEMVERGEALTADTLGTLTTDLFAEGYGGEVAFDPDRLGSTWAQYPHHLRSPFYVYQYTTGLAGAHTLVARIHSGHPGAADAYLTFLKSGDHGYPLDLLRAVGVDLATPDPMQHAFAALSATIDRLETLIP